MSHLPVFFGSEDRGDSNEGLMADGEFELGVSRGGRFSSVPLSPPSLSLPCALPPPDTTLDPPLGGFEFSVTGALVKRKDILDSDPTAKSQSHRTYFYKKDLDLNNVVETCTTTMKKRPISVAPNANGSLLNLALSSHEMDSSTR